MAAKVTSLPKDIYKLSAQKREVSGRKVKKLRKEGMLPTNVYGRDIKSVAVQLSVDSFKKAFGQVGETGLVGLEVNGDSYPVLIHNVQKDPVTGEPLHADFMKVDLTQKVSATVPIEFTGESPIVRSGEGVIVRQMNEIEVEALPTDLPEKIIVDVSGLAMVDDAIKVADLQIDRDKVKLQADPEQIVVGVAPPTKEEEVAPPVAEVPVEGEAPPVEGAPEGGPAAPGVAGSGEAREQKLQEEPQQPKQS